MIAVVKLFFLGPPVITDGDGKAIRFRARKEMALLAYLALEHHASHSRESLAGLLWPDAPDTEARNNLRVVLSRIRQSLKKALPMPSDALPLHTTRVDVQLALKNDTDPADAGVWLDVAAFLAYIHSVHLHGHDTLADCAPCCERLDAALALYKDDFLTGFFIDDSEFFEEWQLLWRERLRTAALEALDQLIEVYTEIGDHERVNQYTRRQLELDPLNESAHRGLMRALLAKRQHNSALQLYERCRTVLQEELGVEPTPETKALAQWIREEKKRPAHISEDSVPKSVDRPQHNLREPLTPLIGREVEMAQLQERLLAKEYRLISIVGPGGIGKSRLALQTAHRQLDHFADGVYFVSLAQVREEGDVPSAIAEAIGVPFGNSPLSPEKQLQNILRGRQLLLVLDNLEHLLGIKALLVAILEDAHGVVLLITSRERLHLQAEDLFRLNGLSTPDATAAAQNLEEIAKYESVCLFRDRAQRLQKGFELDAENASHITRICRMVEGMPLGIELAATWICDFDCAEIADELAGGLDILETTMADVPQQHRSIRSVFDGSWRLLSDMEQATLAQLSVFRGSFTRQATKEVTGVAPMVLTQLRHKSLLRGAGSGRFEIHELLRQFAAEKLKKGGREQVAGACNAHSKHYLSLIAELDDQFYSSNSKVAVERINADLDNVRGGWAWATEQGNIQLLADSHWGMCRFYRLTGLLREGADVFGATVTKLRARRGEDEDPAADVITSLLLIAKGTFLSDLKQFGEGMRTFDEAKIFAHQPSQFARIALGRGRLLSVTASYAQAREMFDEAQHIATKHGLRELRIHVERELAFINFQSGQYEQATARANHALSYYQDYDNQFFLSECYWMLYTIAGKLNEYEESIGYLTQMQNVVELTGDAKGAGLVAHGLANDYNALGFFERAIAASKEAIRIFQAVGDRDLESFALHVLCDSCRELGQLERALESGQRALWLAEVMGSPLAIAFAADYLAAVQVTLEDFGAAYENYARSVDVCRQIGYTEGLPEPLAGMAYFLMQQGRADEALVLANELFQMIDGISITGVDHPLRVYWYCYCVLDAANDPRAPSLLNQGHAQLQKIAGRLHDDGMRKSFLENVRVNRALAMEYEVRVQSGFGVEIT